MKRTFFVMIFIILALTLPAAGNSEKFEFQNGISWNTPLWLVQARERTAGHEPVNVYDNTRTI